MKKLCQLVTALLIISAAVALLTVSFWSVTSIHGEWGAANYWLAWFSAISFILGFAAMVIGGVAAAVFLSELCGQP